MALAITSGEPSGIGPDIIIDAFSKKPINAVVLADISLMRSRAALLNQPVKVVEYQGGDFIPQRGVIPVRHLPLVKKAVVGSPSVKNSAYVLALLDTAIEGCLSGTFTAMVTAPVAKEVIHRSGFMFTGHTEYLADKTNTKEVVMMLASKVMRVALVTTHLPLKKVPESITTEKIQFVVKTVLGALRDYWSITNPKLLVAGLNPHAGEGGALGSEEQEIIIPALKVFSKNNVVGPLSADTMFSIENNAHIDAYIAMYHDQGLGVLKYASFSEAVNITLGLPLVRTSVDHGTAFKLAGTGKVSSSSLQLAVSEATLISEGLSRC